MATFISAPVGQSITVTSGDVSAFSTQLWSSESASAITVTSTNAYVYRWDGTTGTTLGTAGHSERLATLTCAVDVNTTATSCSTSANAAATVTLGAGDRIVVVTSMKMSNTGNGRSVAMYFDSSARTAASLTMKYTVLGNSSTNKPATFTGALDDDFTTDTATTSCSGGSFHNKWTCLQGSATNSSGNLNDGGTGASPSGDSSQWLWLQNKATATTTLSEFGGAPSSNGSNASNTFLYQSMPSAYGDGNVTTVLNSSSFFDEGATPTNSATPYTHAGLVLWSANGIASPSTNPDYLEVQVYASAATNDTGTNTVNVALNNSGTLSGVTSLNTSTSAGKYNNIWLRFANTGGSYQAQYSTDGSSFTNVGSTVAHGAFLRVGLNAYAGIGSVTTSYAGGFEWFQSTLGSPTYNQTSYRWMTNADSTTPGSALAALNTAYSLTSSTQQLRLRQLLHINGNLAANPYNFTNVNSSSEPNDSIPRPVVIGSDGFARIAFNDGSSNLIFIQCTNASCSTNNTTTVASNDNGNNSLAIGSDGFARIAYEDTTTNLRFVQCTNASCSTNNINVIDSGTTGVQISSITMAASDGFARIAYAPSNALKFAQCTNASCSTNNITTVDSGLSVGSFNSVGIGSDGFARISYANGGLKFAQCTNASCSTNNQTSIDTSIGLASSSLGMATSDGFARIAYRTNTNVLKFAQCTNASCSTNNITTVDSSTTAGTEATMALDSNSLAHIAYDQTPSVKLIACTNAACSSSNSLTIDNGTLPAVALGNDGFARIVYRNPSGTLNYAYPISFKLQFAAQGSGCSTASYSDVTNSSLIAYYDNPTPSDEASISSTASDPTETGQTVSPQTYQEINGFTNTSAIGNSVDGEWDFSLFDNGATASTSYCFQMIQSDGTAFTTYTNYPVITTPSVTPTTDQLLRSGEWFSGGSKQPFFWAN